MRVAAAQYDLQRPADWAGYRARLRDWVAAAAAGGAEVAVFPEYAGLELAGLASNARRLVPRQAYGAMQDHIDEAMACHQELARGYGITIVAGSLPVAADSGGFYNRVHVVAPDGAVGAQDKLQLTRVEWATEVMTAGHRLRLFEINGLRLGVILCYDSQFPRFAHAVAQAGADLLVAPSCTHTAAGFNRVRIGSRARALENQVYSLQAPLVGDAAWLPLMAPSQGRAGVFSPPDTGFPADGIVADSADETPGWLWADLNVAAVRCLRDEGQVANFNDWARQQVAIERGVETLVLGRSHPS